MKKHCIEWCNKTELENKDVSCVECKNRPEALLYEGTEALNVNTLIEVLEMYRDRQVIFAGEPMIGFSLLAGDYLLIDTPEMIRVATDEMGVDEWFEITEEMIKEKKEKRHSFIF